MMLIASSRRPVSDSVGGLIRTRDNLISRASLNVVLYKRWAPNIDPMLPATLPVTADHRGTRAPGRRFARLTCELHIDPASVRLQSELTEPVPDITNTMTTAAGRDEHNPKLHCSWRVSRRFIYVKYLSQGREKSYPYRGSDGRCRPQTRRNRRHRDRRRDAGDDVALSGPHPETGSTAPRSAAACSRSTPGMPPRRSPRAVRHGIDHPRRERPLRRRTHPQRRLAGEPRRPVRAALWADGAADFVHDPGIALHEDRWSLAGAPGAILWCSANGPARTRAPPSRRRSPSRTS